MTKDQKIARLREALETIKSLPHRAKEVARETLAAVQAAEKPVDESSEVVHAHDCGLAINARHPCTCGAEKPVEEPQAKQTESCQPQSQEGESLYSLTIQNVALAKKVQALEAEIGTLRSATPSELGKAHAPSTKSWGEEVEILRRASYHESHSCGSVQQLPQLSLRRLAY